MGTKIEDGTGSGKEAAVGANNELIVTRESALTRAARRGDAFIFSCATADINATDTVLAVRNDSSTKNLVIDSIIINNANVAGLYSIHVVTAAYTSAGTAGLVTNMNTNYASTADATAHSDETGNTQGTIIAQVSIPAALEHVSVSLGLILKEGTAVGIDQVTEETGGSASIFAYFIDK